MPVLPEQTATYANDRVSKRRRFGLAAHAAVAHPRPRETSPPARRASPVHAYGRPPPPRLVPHRSVAAARRRTFRGTRRSRPTPRERHPGHDPRPTPRPVNDAWTKLTDQRCVQASSRCRVHRTTRRDPRRRLRGERGPGPSGVAGLTVPQPTGQQRSVTNATPCYSSVDLSTLWVMHQSTQGLPCLTHGSGCPR